MQQKELHAPLRLRGRHLARFGSGQELARAQTVDELKQLSIEDLGKIEVTSVSKQPELLSDAAAAIYVINHDDIIRSGATTLPEMLRLAPNLEVAQLNATSYAISARGFNVGDNASMSNKLLVLIDGRTVYTPLFAGVYWDMQGVPPEDIDRIEVISGPGATLYGANAVNGVINIITRSSADTQGGLVDLGAGNKQDGGLLHRWREGRRRFDLSCLWRGLVFRLERHGKRVERSATPGRRPAGAASVRTGTRTTMSSPSMGDAYFALENPTNRGGRTQWVGSWQRQLSAGSSFQLQGYFRRGDSAIRTTAAGGSQSIPTT